MATRSISTRLAVEGESQYKAAISSVNAELRNMQSALKMTESQYKSNANSSEALTAKGKALNDLLTTQKSKVMTSVTLCHCYPNSKSTVLSAVNFLALRYICVRILVLMEL